MGLKLLTVCAVILMVLGRIEYSPGWDFGFPGGSVDEKMQELVVRIQDSVPLNGAQKIAIAHFTLERTRTSDRFGAFITEQLELGFAQSKKFKLVEQHQLERLLGRRKLEMSDLYDEETVKKLGRFEGVDALLVGTYWDYGEQIKVIAKLVNIETAEQMGNADVLVDKAAIPQRYLPTFEEIKEVQPSALQNRYFLEAYQIDEIARIFVNNQILLDIEIPLHSSVIDYDRNYKRLEITEYLKPGENTLRFVVLNRSLPLEWGRCGYGFKIFKDNELLWQDAKKYPRTFDPDGVFYDKMITVGVEEDYFRINYQAF